MGSGAAAQLRRSMWRNFFPLSLGNVISPGEGKQAAGECHKPSLFPIDGAVSALCLVGGMGEAAGGAGWGARPGGSAASPAACSV